MLILLKKKKEKKKKNKNFINYKLLESCNYKD